MRKRKANQRHPDHSQREILPWRLQYKRRWNSPSPSLHTGPLSCWGHDPQIPHPPLLSSYSFPVLVNNLESQNPDQKHQIVLHQSMAINISITVYMHTYVRISTKEIGFWINLHVSYMSYLYTYIIHLWVVIN